MARYSRDLGGWKWLKCMRCGACCPVGCPHFRVVAGKATCLRHKENDRYAKGERGLVKPFPFLNKLKLCSLPPEQMVFLAFPETRGHKLRGSAISDAEKEARVVPVTAYSCRAVERMLAKLYPGKGYSLGSFDPYAGNSGNSTFDLNIQMLVNARSPRTFNREKDSLERFLIGPARMNSSNSPFKILPS